MLQDSLPYERSTSSMALTGQLDISCILKTWRIKGVLACPWKGDTYFCLWVENAYPCGILEVVRQPWKSHLSEFVGMSGRETTAGHNEEQLQYAEARVFTYIPTIGQDMQIPIAAPNGSSFSTNYVTEMDMPGWRTGLLDLLFSSPQEQVGAWGCAVPRTGFVTQQSEVLAAHLQAVRAGRVAADPKGRMVMQEYDYDPRVGHFIQMVSPSWRTCVSIGNRDLASLERGTLSRYGAYLFIQWGMFEECERCLPPRYLPPRSP